MVPACHTAAVGIDMLGMYRGVLVRFSVKHGDG
jgi:hypothetical protein